MKLDIYNEAPRSLWSYAAFQKYLAPQSYLLALGQQVPSWSQLVLAQSFALKVV